MAHKPTHYGIIFYPDVSEITTLSDEAILDYEGYEIEACIIKYPNADNLIFLADIDNTDEDYGGHFRCFLYPQDNKILGTFKYLKEANLPDEKIDGRYELNEDIVKIWGSVWVEGSLSYGIYAELHPFASETTELPEGIFIHADKILAINAAIADWFVKHPDIKKVAAKELMDHFVSRSIFPADHRDGLPIRNILRALDKENSLAAIPTALAERKTKNTNWFFCKVSEGE